MTLPSTKLLSDIYCDKVVSRMFFADEIHIYFDGHMKEENKDTLVRLMKEWLLKRGIVTKTIYYGKDNVTVGWAGTETFYRDQSEFEGCVKLATKILIEDFKQ